MSNVKKLMMTAAGGEALNVEDVFSTYLYAGDGTNGREINNGIDLSGEGGMVWFKARTTAQNHRIFDTERGSDYSLITNSTAGQANHGTTGLNSFDDDGFTLGNAVVNGSGIYGGDYASWTFRKAPKFFDVVTWTGNGQSTQTIPHNLGSAPGFITIKATGLTQNWWTYHRSLGTGQYLTLNTNSAANSGSIVTATSGSDITVGSTTTSTGYEYVAYLFAHNDDDGGFGPDGDADIIKCGSFTGTGSSAAIDLGFEPQFLLWKQYDGTDDWYIADAMRGITTQDINPPTLRPNLSNAENATSRLGITSTGFEFDGGNGSDYIYMAIRRGPMAVPESADDVFDVVTVASPSAPLTVSNNIDVTDVSLVKSTANAGSPFISQRLTGNRYLLTNDTSAEKTNAGTNIEYDFNYKVKPWYWTSGEHVYYFWKRAPNYFDVVAYTGNGTAGRTVSHNLGVAPEMMWVKARDRTGQWIFYHSGIGNTGAMWINDIGDGVITDSTYWNNTSPSGTNFSLGNNYRVNQSGYNYIAYLFGSVDGVSKVGSYTGDGTDGRTIDCGFSSGARLVLIKDTAANLPFMLYDSERGIVAGNDPFSQLNSTASDTTSFDMLDPDSSGFKVNSTINYVNQSGKTYLFYAIA